MPADGPKEKRPKRLYRWTHESVGFPLPFCESQSAWRRGGLFVISSVGMSPLGRRWQVSISYCKKPPADSVCKEVLEEFDLGAAIERDEAQEWTQGAFRREAHARHFELTQTEGEVN